MDNVAPNRGIDFMDVGRHGGEIYGTERLGKLSRYLDRRGVELVVDDPVMLRMRRAGFASDGSRLYLPSDATKYEVMHELGHYVQFRRIGKEAYQALPRPTAPEQTVYDLLRSNDRRWYERMNLMERLDAQLTIERDGGIAW